MTWAYLKWDQGNQRNVVDTDRPPLRTAEILEQVDTLLANVVANNSLAASTPPGLSPVICRGTTSSS